MISGNSPNTSESNIFNKFSAIKSNREYMLNAYANSANKPNIQYYNDDPIKKPNKKKRIITASFISAIAISASAIALKLLNNKGTIDFSKFIGKGKEKINLKQSADYIKNNNVYKKVINFADNSVNVKDDVYDRITEKFKNTPFKFINKISDVISNIYKKSLGVSMSKKYTEAVEQLKKSGYQAKLDNFEDWYKKTNANMYKTLHKKGNRVSQDIFNKNFIKTMTGPNIANKKLYDVYINEFITPPEGASKELKAAIDNFNDFKCRILPKMRDINCGSAPTDLLTIGASVTGLGVATALGDDKEERKSTLINLGIPLLTTLATTTFGTMKALSGAKSLMFGLITGQAASTMAKLLDKVLTNKQNKTKNEQ